MESKVEGTWRSRIGVFALLALVLAAEGRADVWTPERNQEVVRELLDRMRLEDLAPPAVPVSQNGMSWLAEAVDLLAWPEDAQSAGRAALDPGRSSSEWSERERAAVRAFVAENESAWRAASRAFRAPHLGFGLDYGKGLEMEIPDLLGFLDLARLHRARGELALESGDAAGIRSSLAGLGAMAGAFYRESTLITALVGLAVEREQLRLVASILESGVTDPSPEIVARLLPSEPLPVVLQRSLSAEALMFRDASRAVRLGASEDLSLRQVLLAPFDGLIEDDGLDFFAATIAATAEPWAAWRVREETGELDPGFWARLSPLPPRADEIVEKVAGVAASRQLARLALRLAATVGDLADPERLSDAPASPYSGARPRIESGPDGRRVLVDPSAERLWSLSNPGKELRRRPIFRWVLPPESERGAPRSSVS